LLLALDGKEESSLIIAISFFRFSLALVFAQHGTSRNLARCSLRIFVVAIFGCDR
jgi:hypothetical protein